MLSQNLVQEPNETIQTSSIQAQVLEKTDIIENDSNEHSPNDCNELAESRSQEISSDEVLMQNLTQEICANETIQTSLFETQVLEKRDNFEEKKNQNTSDDLAESRGNHEISSVLLSEQENLVQKDSTNETYQTPYQAQVFQENDSFIRDAFLTVLIHLIASCVIGMILYQLQVVLKN